MQRLGAHQSNLLSVVSQSCVFDENIRIPDKMAMNFDASDFTLSYRKGFQVELVSEVINAKNFCFHIQNKC